jgi:hypothetical protein
MARRIHVCQKSFRRVQFAFQDSLKNSGKKFLELSSNWRHRTHLHSRKRREHIRTWWDSRYKNKLHLSRAHANVCARRLTGLLKVVQVQVRSVAGYLLAMTTLVQKLPRVLQLHLAHKRRSIFARGTRLRMKEEVGSSPQPRRPVITKEVW